MRRSGRSLLPVLPAVFLAVWTGVVWGQPARGPAPSPRPGGVRVGQPAPDFELPLLKADVDPAGNAVNRITDATVRLSSFRRKSLVCLFFSSYT